MALLTVKEAASYIRVSAGHLNNLRTAGKGPRFVKLGPHKVLYDTRDLDRWIDDHKQNSTSDQPELRRRRRYLTLKANPEV
jgi:predicted DNA-binding transcriptional regulator AlpA